MVRNVSHSLLMDREENILPPSLKPLALPILQHHLMHSAGGPGGCISCNLRRRGLDSPETTDIRDTKCLVLIGSHIGENMHNGQVQEMSDAIDKGATIITVDPRFSTAAGKSKFWLPIKPATDMALLLSWIHVNYTVKSSMIKNMWKNILMVSIS